MSKKTIWVDISMFKRRIRVSGETGFPYGKPIAISCGLLIATIFAMAILADPKSGEIRPPVLVWLAIAGLPAAIAAVFYTESKLRNKRGRSGKC